MNKIYKVIWNEARNAYVVVSEIAKNHGSKSCSTKKLLAMLIATGVMTCASVAPAMAANLAPEDTKIEAGKDASASGQGSVAIGENAQASGLVGIAIGRDAVASGVDSIAIGSDTKATQQFSVAVGNDIGFTAYAGTAVGQQAYASGDNATAIGTMTNVDAEYNASHDDWRKAGVQSTAIGAYAGSWGVASTAVGGFSKAEGRLATAIGYNSQANVDYGTALGDYSEVTAGRGVAIGASSFADRESHVVGLYAPDEDKDSLTWKANAGAVSVGSSVEGQEITRQITNVAAGSADTDAVNVAQLNAVKAAAGKKVSLVDGENTKATLVKDDATGTQYKVDVDLSKYAKTEDVAVVYDKNKTSLRSTNASVAENAIALGKDAIAVKDGGVALGNEAHAGNKGTSLGTKAKSGREGATVVGYNTNSSGLYSTVVGTDAVINTDGTAYQTPFKDVIVQGAAATVVGSKNTVDNENGKVYSGVANNVMGSANTIKGSNGVTIQGTGNKVTDAYKDMNITTNEGLAILGGDYSVLAKKQSGAVAVVGGANTVSKQTDSTVIGYDNKLTGDKEKGSHDVFMAGSHNRLNNVSDSIVMGNKNTIEGVSNVISFGHDNKIKASNAVAIGNGAGVSVEGGVALGVGSVADRAAGEVVGYDPTTGKAYNIENGNALDYVWKATKGAVSVGSGRETRQITNVAAGAQDTDAVNVAQLKKVATEAGKHTQVKAGTNVGIVPDKTEDGTHVYTVNADGTTVSGDSNVAVTAGKKDANNVTNYGVKLNKDLKGIESISNGDAKLTLGGFTTELTNGKGAAITLFGDTTTINNKVTVYKDGRIAGVAAGINDKDAVNVGQLNAVGATANKGWNLATNGVATEATNVKPGDYVDFSGDQNVSISKDAKGGVNTVKVELNKDLTGIETISNDGASLTLNGTATELTNGKGAAITLFGDTTTINNKVTVYKDGRIAGVAAGINDKDAVNVGQLNAVGATANKGWNLATNGVATEATNVKPGGYVDFSGDKNISVSHDGTKVKVELNKNIDVNSVQTNALNSKYNLSVGTMAENGIMPFLVNSTGAFYAANNNFSVDKDGKVIATAGEIGNVVLQNGVYTGNSALRDGELYVGDADGNYSQITTKGAKLGKVTVAEDGKISGVAAGEADTDAVNVSQLQKVSDTANAGWNLSTNGVATEATNVKPGDYVDFSGDKNISVSHDGTKVKVELNKDIDVNSVQTNALNSKYNLSVGTMAENGIMPFLVNSTGAFYAANNNFSVDKDGKVIATAGEIGNVVLQNGVYTGNSALRDGELYVGDADGNYSQITTKGAKLGKVTVAEDGKISGVAAGEADTDAVNVSQLQKVSDTANAGWNLSTNGVATEATNVKPGDYVDFSGDKNISVSHDGTKVKVELNKDIDVNSVKTNALNSKYNLSVGTMAENGIMPFLVNSTGAFYAANNNFSVDKDGKVIATAGEIGNVVLQNGVYTGNSALRDGELYVGDASGNYSQITTTGAKLGQVTIAADGKISGVAAGVEKTDAVNVGQLKDYVAANDTHIKSGNYAVGEVTDSTGNKSQGVSMDIVNKEGKVTGTVTITDVAKASDVGDVNNIASDIKNQDGSHTTVVHAVNNLNNKLDTKVGDLQYSKVEKGDIADGDSTTTAIGKLDQKLTDVAATAAKHTKVEGSSNIIVTNTAKEGEAANYKVELKKDIDVDTVKATTVTTGQTVMNNDGVKVGKDVSVTATAVTAGQTSISNDGLKVNGKTYVSDSGLNANDQKITNVADGKVEKGSTDAVNGGQLYNETRVAKDGNFVKKSNTAGENLSALDNQVTANTESIYHMNGRISDLDNRVNKVGAGAAALAALHPLDFDPDAKWDFAAGYGNYRGANAAAVGAYYRPNEDTMFSVGGTFGNGENMVNAGVSFKLGSGSSHVSTSRVAMAKEIKELRGELEAMKSAMLDANAGKKIDTSKLQLFPDVPQNHWAYEYVAQLAGNGMIEGYPDGNFAGDRPMTRYEFAAILYRAMTKGAVLSDKILSEFSHELEYFTVDTIAKDKAGNPTIQRVRTVKENKNK